MYYVCMLKEKNSGKFYYGYTNNLEWRISEHNRAKGQELIYYEAYKSEIDARNREGRLKNYAQALSALKKRLNDSLR